MKMIISMTDRGVVTLPSAVRKELKLKPDDLFEVELRPEGILLRPVVTVPVEIYTPARLREFAAEEAKLERSLKRKKKRIP